MQWKLETDKKDSLGLFHVVRNGVLYYIICTGMLKLDNLNMQEYNAT